MVNKPKAQLILGSQSPRRQELLKWIYLPFKIIKSDIDEISHETKADLLVMDLARQKAINVFHKAQKKYSTPIIIGADTIVVLGEEVLGKPRNKEHARDSLLKLQAKTHRVLTGVCIKWQTGEELFYEETQVQFDEINDDLLELYLNTNESLDKAGAYGIQGAALGFINKLNGSYSNVVGLPINLVLQKLKKIASDQTNENWRDYFEKI
jgi:septum formation protein